MATAFLMALIDCETCKVKSVMLTYQTSPTIPGTIIYAMLTQVKAESYDKACQMIKDEFWSHPRWDWAHSIAHDNLKP
jgi:hypothetical protein